MEVLILLNKQYRFQIKRSLMLSHIMKTNDLIKNLVFNSKYQYHWLKPDFINETSLNHFPTIPKHLNGFKK